MEEVDDYRRREGEADGNPLMHAKVFAAAVKFDIPALRKLSASKFASAAEVNWNHITFAEAVRSACTTTPDDVRELRDIVSNTIHCQSHVLDKVSIEAVVKDIGALNFELISLARGMPALAESRIVDRV